MEDSYFRIIIWSCEFRIIRLFSEDVTFW
jgi:hypothetical protein